MDRQNRGEPILEVVETEEGELEKPYAQKIISSALARGQTVFKLPLNEFKSVLVVPHGAKLSERAERMHLSGIPIHCMSK